MKFRRPRLTAVAGMVLASTLLFTGTASADLPAQYNGDGVNIRSQPSNTAPVVGKGYRSHDVRIICYTDSPSTPVSASSYYKVRDYTINRTGWVKPPYVVHTSNAPRVQC